MTNSSLHAWDLSPDEAARAQASLRERLVQAWDGRPVGLVGGVDVSIKEETARAAIVVLRFPGLQPVEGVVADAPLVFPYIPGLLAFREGPAVLAAWALLKTRPDLLMFDGQGIAHPRGMGIAAHLGVWLDMPAIGVAKSRLYGRHAGLGPNRGDVAWLRDERDRERIIGAVLRSRDGVKPLYVSPGQRMDVPTALEFVQRCLTRYRLPEPTRWAHRVAGGENLPPAG